MNKALLIFLLAPYISIYNISKTFLLGEGKRPKGRGNFRVQKFPETEATDKNCA